jgi:hypothetical protein
MRNRVLSRLRAGDHIWIAIANFFRPASTEKPRGLDAFLEEMGL